ncbi:MAG: LOG family protein [Candidatus Wallbacteria bacterium]
MEKNNERKKRIYTTGNTVLDSKIKELSDEFSKSKNSDLINEIIITAFKLLNDDIDRLDIKIINSALKEIRHAFSLFSKYRSVKKVSIFGSARTPSDSPDYKIIAEFAQKIIKENYMVITGAGPGIMQAGNEGAGADNSFGVSIKLPFEYEPNPFISKDKVINFKYFFTRKLAFAKETNAFVLGPGGVGTLDEGFEVITLLQTGKSNPLPVVMLEAPGGNFWKKINAFMIEEMLAKKLICEEDTALYKICYDSGEAVDEIKRFYNNYHSIRFVNEILSIRVARPIPDEALRGINEKFRGIINEGSIENGNALFEESNEAEEIRKMPRLLLKFNKKSFNKLRMLIDEINKY